MAAKLAVLQELHEVFAEYLLSLLQPTTGEDGGQYRAEISAPQMAVIAKFLKDNDISAADDDDESVKALKEGLRSNALQRGFDKSDIELALEASEFSQRH